MTSSTLMGVGASAAAGAATGMGALPILNVRSISVKTEDAMLGFAAGVMTAASFFSLISPGSRPPALNCAIRVLLAHGYDLNPRAAGERPSRRSAADGAGQTLNWPGRQRGDADRRA